MKVKWFYITFILILVQNILAQTTVVISNGTGIYIPFGVSFCADTIKVLEDGYYITADSSGTCPGAIIIGGGFISLPVELSSFTASTSKGRVTLNWVTATETNNSGFEIQRKTDNNWEKISFVDGHGTTTEMQNYQFIDDISDIQATSLSYRLKQIDFDGSYEYSDEVLVDNPAPSDFILHQNYPNPFNPETIIKYGISTKTNVQLSIYNALGEMIQLLINEVKTAGNYEISFDASNLPSGIYFYRIQAGTFVETKKMILLK